MAASVACVCMDACQRLSAVPPDEARALLRGCCGSRRWVDGMMACLPFASDDALIVAARQVWFALSAEDWQEAFSEHPQIGDRDALARRFPATHRLSEREQAAVEGAPGDVLAALVEGNRRYVERFGYIFIVCATGRSAEEMLAVLERRLANPPETELGVAANEHARITEIRLAALTRA
jgi:2-oxo-4-hydroxy-4-carboxy-5-ureidoimidazoline decarboxylase